jgi:predicted esterase
MPADSPPPFNPPTLGRRTFLGLGGAILGAPTGTSSGANFSIHDIKVSGSRRIGQRFTLLLPRHPTAKPLRLLVALHGLGETHSQRIGARAWIDRYGLGTCYGRLLAPPVKALGSRSRHWTSEQLNRINLALKQRAFRGFAVLCPFTPNVYRLPRKKALDDYASWLSDEVLPRARREANISHKAKDTHLCGCSLGGYVGLEVLLRKSTTFGAFSSLQGALGRHRIARYSKSLAALSKQHGPRPFLLASSSADPFLDVNRQLYNKLRKQHLDAELYIGKGPHNQPYLRDHGTLQLLLWHDRQMT